MSQCPVEDHLDDDKNLTWVYNLNVAVDVHLQQWLLPCAHSVHHLGTVIHHSLVYSAFHNSIHGMKAPTLLVDNNGHSVSADKRTAIAVYIYSYGHKASRSYISGLFTLNPGLVVCLVPRRIALKSLLSVPYTGSTNVPISVALALLLCEASIFVILGLQICQPPEIHNQQKIKGDTKLMCWLLELLPLSCQFSQ